MKSNKSVFLGEKVKTMDTKFSDVAPCKAGSVATPQTLESLLAHTAFQMKEIHRGLDLTIANGRVDADNYHFAKSIATLYKAETHLDVVASNKILIQPRVQGLDINVYYRYSEGRRIYEFARAVICNEMAVQNLSSEELDVTDKIQGLIDTFVNIPSVRTLPNYINNQLFIVNGCGLDIDEDAPPKAIAISITLTVPAMDILKTGHDMEALIRGWLNNPRHMLGEGYPKMSFVATDIKAKTGYLSTSFDMPRGDLDSVIEYFQITKKSLMACLNEAGFETAIEFTTGNDTALVRGTVMGASHLCIENYIAPALESIKATKTRLRALKTDKARERFIKSTEDKAEDQHNILNYLRTFKYFATGVMVEPNYLCIRRRVANAVEEGLDRLYVDPAIVAKLNDSSVLEIITTMGLGVSDAIDVVNYTGYEGHRNVFSKKALRELKRDLGIEITEDQVSVFRDNFERIKEVRNTNSVPSIIMMREKLWNV